MEGHEVVSVIEEHIKALEPDEQVPALLTIIATVLTRFTTSIYECIGAVDAMKQAIYVASIGMKKEE